jgi:adenine phosphoribosyltransferase
VARAELHRRLIAAFRWRTDRSGESEVADVTGWWRDPLLLADLGAGLADLYRDSTPTVVVGVESRGCVLGPLVAVSLGVGFVEVRKNPDQVLGSEQWLHATTPPDYRDRHLTLGLRRELLAPGDRVLLADDWIATGGQAAGVRRMVDEVGGCWIGVAAVVDALDSHEIRRVLGVRSLVRVRQLS